jgi:hypothetical protein
MIEVVCNIQYQLPGGQNKFEIYPDNERNILADFVPRKSLLIIYEYANQFEPLPQSRLGADGKWQ